MRVVIDRFEGEFAVVELDEGSFADMPRSLLPNAKEGDTVTIEVHHDDERRQRIKSLADELFR